MRLFRRMWDSPKLIPVLFACCVLALFSAVLALQVAMVQDDRREQDRITADFGTCQRINILRHQMVDGFSASALALERTLDVFFPAGRTGDPVRDARVVAVRSQIDPILAQLKASVADVKFTDCAAVTPGVRSTTPTTEAP